MRFLGLGIGLFVAAAGGLAYHRLRHLNPHRPKLERIELPLPAGAVGLHGLRIAFITDTHIGPFTTPLDLKRGIDLLEHEPFDLLLLGGDYVSESNLYARPMADAMKELVLRAPLGAYAVMGNHDLPLGVNKVRAELERVGITVLRNEHAVLDWHGAQLAIAGIDDTIVGSADPAEAFAGIPYGVPVLSLWHEADFAERAAELGAFAQLSGHTHGGQVRLPFIGAIWLPPDGKLRDVGSFEVDGMTTYVSRGLGVYRPPVRFLCPPEVTLITLRSDRPMRTGDARQGPAGIHSTIAL